MMSLFAALRTRTGLAGVAGTLAIGLVVWFFLPALLGPTKVWILLPLAILPLLLWIGFLAWQVRRAKRRDAALVAGATATQDGHAADARAQAIDEEQQVVARRLGEALGAIKTAGKGQSSALYERPWYVLIGPPGSGKTTAIRNSGLDFPLAEGRVAGVGGTRNCDWWIAEQAVLIDTAGRYTTQDSDAEADRAGWQRFLDLLRRERPRQPLNGVIVAFGIDLLSSLDATQREQHAQAVRRRVRELEQRLGQRLPVYLLVSKTDLVAGFTEFFDDLDRETRAQVWGMTFDAKVTEEGQTGAFESEFSSLVQRLQARLLQRLQAERGAEQRAALAGFPAQFASVGAPLAAFVQAAFKGSRLDPAPFLRGVYFTSGTQEGTPIDRLTAALSRSLGVTLQRVIGRRGAQGRSYFLGRLLTDVVFNEARLAIRDRSKERRQRWITRAVAGLSVLLAAAGLAWGWVASARESSRFDRVELAAQAATSQSGTVAAEVLPASANPSEALALLDGVRAVGDAAEGSSGHAGFSQADKLASGGQVAYQHALERALLPRLLGRLEAQMRARLQDPMFLYVATRVYLMLGRQGPMDAGLIREWMGEDWKRQYPGPLAEPVRQHLSAHLDALLASDFRTYPLDGALIDEARRVFSRLPLADRVYARLKGAASRIKPWRPLDVLGPAGQRLFVIHPGALVPDGNVPGIYTVNGFYQGLLPALPKAVADAASESWVLGPTSNAAVGNPSDLERDVLALYARDYISTWQAELDALDLAPLGSGQAMANSLNVLSAPNSPMRDLVRDIGRQLSPGTPPADVAAASGLLQKAAAAGTAALGSVGTGIGALLGGAAPVDPVATVGKSVEDHFAALRALNGPAMEGVLKPLNDLYQDVAKEASAAPGSMAPAAAGGDAGARLMAFADTQPAPVSRWLRAAGHSGADQHAGGVKAALAAAAGQSLQPFCKGVEARFPFNHDPAAPDMPVDDFLRLFGPNGAFDQYVAQNLRDSIDMTQRVWRPVAVAGGAAPISAGDVTQFQRAQAIRNAFFPPTLPGQATPALSFDLTPIGTDPGGAGASLQVDSARSNIATGGTPVRLTWPAHGRLVLAFPGEAPGQELAIDGPWAALRLVAYGKLQAVSGNDRFRLHIARGAHWAEFDIRVGSIVNPLALPELTAFHCPALKT